MAKPRNTLAQAAMSLDSALAGPPPVTAFQEPKSHIRFSMGPGEPMQEFQPSPPKTPLELAAEEEAYRRYRENAFGAPETAQEDMEVARADVFRDAYLSGNLTPGKSSAGSGSYKRSIVNENNEIIGYLDASGRPNLYPEGPVGRASGQNLAEREAATSRATAIGRVEKLRDLATRHKDKIGPYVSQYVKLQRSGVGAPFGIDAVDPEVADMYSIAEDISNAKIYEQSGKAINKEEFERLKPVMPRFDTSPEQFWVNLDRFEKELRAKNYTLTPGSQRGTTVGPASSGRSNSYTTRSGNTVEVLD